MSFTFNEVTNVEAEDPSTRFAPPNANTTFKWWKCAVPQPAYRFCVVRINSINGAQLDCTPLDIDAKPMKSLSLDLDDWTHVWRGQPSTIDRPALTNDATCNHALLCIAEPVLLANGWTPAQLQPFDKWPRGEDLTLKYNALEAFVRNLMNTLPVDQIQKIPGFSNAKLILDL